MVWQILFSDFSLFEWYVSHLIPKCVPWWLFNLWQWIETIHCKEKLSRNSLHLEEMPTHHLTPESVRSSWLCNWWWWDATSVTGGGGGTQPVLFLRSPDASSTRPSWVLVRSDKASNSFLSFCITNIAYILPFILLNICFSCLAALYSYLIDQQSGIVDFKTLRQN